MIYIRDTVHGDIKLYDIYANILDTPEFQRLRSIEQGSFRPVFPGARHDRFIHSLGTYHLACKFSRSFFKNIRRDFPSLVLTQDQEQELIATFRYAALLHDIGHAPYSHTTEDFFCEKKNGSGGEVIRDDLRAAIASLGDQAELDAFDADFPKCDPSAHEIISATLLVTQRTHFLVSGARLAGLVDTALAARMVIGCTYDYNRYTTLSPNEKMILGLRNCLIRLLNSSAVDVDRLDYLIRDTRMSGFINTPVDVDFLADSVTAIALDGTDWLYPAFRNDAMGVLESMFHAKREHDFWVLNHPSGAYDSELRAHCISRMEDFPGNSKYMTTVFSAKALGREGVTVEGRTYRLLSDEDICADLKRHYGAYKPIQEIFCRELRRTPLWRDYYELRWLFRFNEQKVYEFFLPLMNYMKKKHFFQLDGYTYPRVMNEPDGVEARESAQFLHDFFRDQNMGDQFDLVLLPRKAIFTYKFNPKETYIQFPKLPTADGKNYTTFAELKGQEASPDKRDMFYIYAPKAAFSPAAKAAFRDQLLARFSSAPAPARIPHV